ncbi:UDP-N-acetylmuramoyl-L-alanine--D-glutamate ligase [Methylonatrum kenyense]|nr:UDP-N-acetylmuramoyl-L-alanine--D-glutamate ligase [Methylonatrum kenyense]MCK8516290.1 UDP-N-acetylmuramoyl-L-alanine--D-glutamate ligase [Methylonatrum kenyense]
MTQTQNSMRSTVVVGLGATGLSCLRFLRRRGEVLWATDSRAEPPGRREAADLVDRPLALGGLDAALILDADRVIVSPGVAADLPVLQQARTAGREVFGDIELFARHANAPVVAITGSNGKSTVTSMLAAMAEQAGFDAAVGGNLGTPALELIRESAPDAYFLELSSFQLETTDSLRPVAAVVLNVSADHMDRHQSVERYAAIKSRIYNGDGVMLVNADDPRVLAMARDGRHVIRFSTLAPANDEDYGLLERGGEVWLMRGGEQLMPASALLVRGRHNLANALAALALARVLDLPLAACRRALQAFPGLPHRGQWLARKGGVDWFNDSKATNVGAAAAAIAGMPGPLVLLLGGDGKGADFTPLADCMDQRIRAVVLLGQDAPQIAAVLSGRVDLHQAADLQHAVRLAAELAQAGDSVLFSPACASFDMFENYQARGDAFAEAVGRLPA